MELGARVAHAIRRRVKWVLLSAKYWLKNRASQTTICAYGSGIDVTLTTHGKRVNSVYLTIESIAGGDLLPERIYLFLSSEKQLPRTLQRLERRGLIIRPDTKGIGPHNKYYNYVTAVVRDPESKGFVTADDDILYPKKWLSDMVARRGTTEKIICHSARRSILYRSSGELAAFNDWPSLQGDETQGVLFFEGVGGVLYPPRIAEVLRSRGTAFLATAPKADDIWLNWVVRQLSIPVVRLPSADPLPYVPRYIAQAGGLFNENIGTDLNQGQFEATFGPEGIEALEMEIERSQH